MEQTGIEQEQITNKTTSPNHANTISRGIQIFLLSCFSFSFPMLLCWLKVLLASPYKIHKTLSLHISSQSVWIGCRVSVRDRFGFGLIYILNRFGIGLGTCLGRFGNDFKLLGVQLLIDIRLVYD